ncbi:MAG: glycoside hydrolase family 16 protein [Paracoccaceae bacterium]
MTVGRVSCAAIAFSLSVTFAAADPLAETPALIQLPLAIAGTPPAEMAATRAGTTSVQLERTFLEDFTDFSPATPPWRHMFDRKYDTDEIERRTLASNREEQIYVDPTFAGTGTEPLGLNPFDTAAGILRITGQKAPDDALPFLGGYRYTSGLLTTEGHFEQQYGYFEARMKLPIGQGLWPAFWMKRAARLAPDGTPNWPPEIDIMEFIGSDPDRYFVTTHWDLAPDNKKSGASFPLPDGSEAFRNYGVLWDARRTVFYLDRVPHHVIETKANHHVPMFMMLNLALGGKWPGPIDPSVLPATVEIDWVAAWQFEDR